jgi:hypothetical protein
LIVILAELDVEQILVVLISKQYHKKKFISLLVLSLVTRFVTWQSIRLCMGYGVQDFVGMRNSQLSYKVWASSNQEVNKTFGCKKMVIGMNILVNI